METRIATLLASWEIAPDVRHFVFAIEGEPELHFLPGQFVSFTEQIDGKAITRAYSIASIPNGNRFELCLNLVKDGRFSPRLFAMRPGETVPMKGPLGTFTLSEPSRESLHIAVGTGIAPIRGLLLEARRAGAAPATLIYGARHEHGLLYREEFEAMEKEVGKDRFRFHPTITRPTEAWKGATGRVQVHLEPALNGRTDVNVYVCGMKEMVNDVRAWLKEHGVDRKRIHFEKYD
ncbi:MAG: FAD-dependent oxidoreductase [Bryobacterales bacterium]|nr:FAD-dependent oxidoreductase [Bryobacterales bacterium]